ncbi:hypothetical protein TCAL_07708 [Tigriopus californicus]|uniref:Sugar phosphate transporter domain-containing protein n=2 Tax=Tigriopus californicus TaxID=6832 RepID=A0A553NBP2_TIGCA|nr:hypothetical protein TCAL_07708 [Tigriopus californicus]|eukprot:TCALIF_07708-PA protein Name:"Similar to tmem241 Transmembrane protein 241 (Xenopus laevis)" AED:0.18 eAED:0.37 QI:0/-1/0/1/-1/1/1/0/389
MPKLKCNPRSTRFHCRITLVTISSSRRPLASRGRIGDQQIASLEDANEETCPLNPEASDESEREGFLDVDLADPPPSVKTSEMNRYAAFLYFFLLILCNFSNKFVLTVLGFHYPMVFQGWQMLVGVILYQILRATGAITFASIPMDPSGFISLLPNFLFFTSGIIAGSKALASIPLVLFLAIGNCLPASLHLVDVFYSKPNQYGGKSLLGAIFVLVSAMALLVTEPRMSLLESPYFWLCVHVICQLFYTLHGRIADARFNSVDRQYYSYIFGLIVLAPASLYLEEAFNVLEFQEISQIMFICGSIVSAVSGVFLHLYQSRLRNDSNFGKVHHVGIILTALLSLIPFEHEFSGMHAPIISLTNILSLYFIPCHINPDETKLTESSINFSV